MKGHLVAWLVGPTLLLLGLAIFLSPRLVSIPLAEPAVVLPSQIDPAPLRKPLSRPPTIRVAGYQKNCMDCHALFQSRTKTPFAMFQHREIQRAMDHGTNRRCYNCHDLKSRDKLVLDDGTLVGFDHAELVCAKCHGTTYRDWQRGAHGKTEGYWDASLGKPNRFICTQCHDPHAPAFGKFKPLPGPHTLRMEAIPRTPGHVGRGREKVNPLRTWSSSDGPHRGRANPPVGMAESGEKISSKVGQKPNQQAGQQTGEEKIHE